MSGVSVVSDQRSAIAKAGPGLSRLRCGLTQRKKAVRNSRGIRADGERDAIKARFEITSSATIVLARSQTTAFLLFAGTIASLAAFATRHLTTFFAGILICSPVAGFRPLLPLRSTRTTLPRPGTINTPFAFISFTALVP